MVILLPKLIPTYKINDKNAINRTLTLSFGKWTLCGTPNESDFVVDWGTFRDDELLVAVEETADDDDDALRFKEMKIKIEIK